MPRLCEGRWKMTVPMPDKYKDMVMYDATERRRGVRFQG